MSRVYKCERCGKFHEAWTKFGKRLPGAKVKTKRVAGRFYYTEADLCQGCTKELEQFMKQQYNDR